MHSEVNLIIWNVLFVTLLSFKNEPQRGSCPAEIYPGQEILGVKVLNMVLNIMRIMFMQIELLEDNIQRNCPLQYLSCAFFTLAMFETENISKYSDARTTAMRSSYLGSWVDRYYIAFLFLRSTYGKIYVFHINNIFHLIY